MVRCGVRPPPQGPDLPDHFTAFLAPRIVTFLLLLPSENRSWLPTWKNRLQERYRDPGTSESHEWDLCWGGDEYGSTPIGRAGQCYQRGHTDGGSWVGDEGGVSHQPSEGRPLAGICFYVTPGTLR